MEVERNKKSTPGTTSQQQREDVAPPTGAKPPQIWRGLVASIGSFILGTSLGWTSTSAIRLQDNKEYGFAVNNTEFSLIGSLMAIGALVVTPLVGWMVTYLGRKPSMLLLCVPAAAGYAVMAWAQNVVMFYVGRVLTGAAGGGFSVVVPMYMGEFAEPEIRGTLGTFFQLTLNVGILFCYVLGSIVNVFWLTLCCMLLPVVYFVLVLLLLPESPVFLVEKNKIEEARKSLQSFRGKKYNIDQEMESLQKSLEEVRAQKLTLLQAFSTKTSVKALVLCIGLMFFQQFCGINSIIFYSDSIFRDAGSTLNSNVCTIITGVVLVVSTYVSTVAIDQLGRRLLLLMSDATMAVSTLIVGFFFFCKDKGDDVTSFGLAPVFFVCIFLIAFSIGFGPIPWLYFAEVFPRQVAGYAASIICMSNYIFTCIITFGFDPVSQAIGKSTTFFGFTVISAVGTVFVFFFIIETKSKTLEQILKEL